MMHGLPRVFALIDHDAVSLGKSQAFLQPSDFLQRPSDERGAVLVQIRKISEMLLRHAQQMHGGFGFDVFENDDFLVLIDFGRRDFPRDDFAENTIFHMILLFLF